MRNLLRPKVVVPMVLGLALIGALLGVSDVRQVGATMGQLQARSVLAFFVLMLLYEAVRGVQWHVLLRGLRLHVPSEAEAFSFVLGEATKSAPIGNYFQNYLLSRVEGEDVAVTSATTTLVVLTEVGVSLVGVAALGIDGWTWVRLLIGIGLPVFLVLVWIGHRYYGNRKPPAWTQRHPATRTLLDEVGRFRTGMLALVRPSLLIVETALSASYLLLAAAALFVVARAIGIDSLDFWQILAVYLFSLGAGLILPVPVDLGVVEVSGVGALVASGLSRELALSLMLANRLLTFGSAAVIAGVSMLVLRGELGRALRDRPGDAAAEGEPRS